MLKKRGARQEQGIGAQREGEADTSEDEMGTNAMGEFLEQIGSDYHGLV